MVLVEEIKLIFAMYQHLSEAESIADFPTYTSNGSWKCCSHWSNGYAIGTFLLDHFLETNKVPAIDKLLELLGSHYKSDDFQDIGYLFQSSAVLRDKLTGVSVPSMESQKAISYLLNCIDDTRNLIVNWRPKHCYGIDQFANSLLLGWGALKLYSVDIFTKYSRLVRNSIKLFVHEQSSYEYISGESVFNHNSGSKDATWLRGHAWAIMGVCYAIFVYSSRSESVEDLAKSLETLIETIKQLLKELGDLPCVFSNDGESVIGLQDISATCCIATSLLFLSNSSLLESDSCLDVLHHLQKLIEQNVSNGTLINVSYPSKLIDVPSETAAWGCYFYLQYCVESSNEKSRIDII